MCVCCLCVLREHMTSCLFGIQRDFVSSVLSWILGLNSGCETCVERSFFICWAVVPAPRESFVAVRLLLINVQFISIEYEILPSLVHKSQHVWTSAGETGRLIEDLLLSFCSSKSNGPATSSALQLTTCYGHSLSLTHLQLITQIFSFNLSSPNPSLYPRPQLQSGRQVV